MRWLRPEPPDDDVYYLLGLACYDPDDVALARAVIREYLAAHPDGALCDDIAEASGLKSALIEVVLLDMEKQGAVHAED